LLTLQVWNLMPLDPVAWLVMYGEHQAALADLIAANMRHRLPLEAVRDAPPPLQQVCVHPLCILRGGGLCVLHVQSPPPQQARFSMCNALVCPAYHCCRPVHVTAVSAKPVQTM
jgi:hypothetical protein